MTALDRPLLAPTTLRMRPRGAHARAVVLSALVVLGTLIMAASAQAAFPSIYVANAFGFSHPSRLTGYAGGASGNVTPLTDLSGPTTALTGAAGLARASGGSVWVADQFSAAVRAYPPGATGDTAPTAAIQG